LPDSGPVVAAVDGLFTGELLAHSHVRDLSAPYGTTFERDGAALLLSL
jgi:hypothetical protein